MRLGPMSPFLAIPVVLIAISAKADIVTNGSFDSGTLAGWTVFTTPNGTTGSGLPTVTSFNTTGLGASNAAEFNVGEVVYNSTPQGGGLYQTITVPVTGTYTLTEYFAAVDSNTVANADAGTYSILINGTSVATDSLGGISAGGTLRGSINQSVFLNAGTYTFETEITRLYQSNGIFTPTEYLDDISLTPAVASSPEPSSFALLASSLLGLAAIARRKFVG